MRALLSTGAITAAIGVMLGAFGAHALKERLDPQMLVVWQTAVQYHLIHALGMIAVALAATQIADSWVSWSGWLMFAGVCLFSGSPYLFVLTDTRWLGAITPLGGILFIAGWLLFAFTAWKTLR